MTSSFILPTSSLKSSFLFPPSAFVGRNLPKNKIYEHSGANARLKDLFVKEVEQIVWQYKLAPETINLPARPGVPELQVFGLQLKTPELNRDVLRAIDGAVQFPILFELSFDGRTQVVACYKRPSDADASRWVISDYFATGWLPAGAQRAAMPLALDLASLYEQLLHRLIPLPARPREPLAALVARFEQVQARQREVARTAARLEKEKQFNRKVELNAALRKLKTELEQLMKG
ncbi:MAG: DUF4391 domain-containing protein [Porticoccaceae bacterium]